VTPSSHQDICWPQYIRCTLTVICYSSEIHFLFQLSLNNPCCHFAPKVRFMVQVKHKIINDIISPLLYTELCLLRLLLPALMWMHVLPARCQAIHNIVALGNTAETFSTVLKKMSHMPQTFHIKLILHLKIFRIIIHIRIVKDHMKDKKQPKQDLTCFPCPYEVRQDNVKTFARFCTRIFYLILSNETYDTQCHKDDTYTMP